MRVVHLVSSLGPNASARFLALVLPHLAIDSLVLNLSESRPFAGILRARGIAVEPIAIRGPIDLSRMRTVFKRVQEYSPDIVHVWGARAAAFANVLISPFHPSSFVLIQSEIGLGDLFTSPLIGRIKRLAAKATLSIPVVDPTPCEPTTLASLGLPSNAKVVLNTGAFDDQSDQRSAVWTFDMIRYVHPTAHMLIAGDGPSRDKVEAFARSVSRGDNRIHFLGLRADVPSLLRGSAVAFVTHRQGGRSFLAESLASGTPTVAVASADSRTIVRDGENGRLVPRGDYPSQARALLEILRDEQLAERLSEAGRRTQFTTPDSAAAELSAIYRSHAR